MKVFKVKIEDHQNFQPEGPRFTITIEQLDKPSPYQGESIITTSSDYVLNLSPNPGNKEQTLEVHAVSAARVLHMLLILRGLSPYNEWIKHNLHKVRLLDFHVEAYTYYELNLLHIKP